MPRLQERLREETNAIAIACATAAAGAGHGAGGDATDGRSVFRSSAETVLHGEHCVVVCTRGIRDLDGGRQDGEQLLLDARVLCERRTSIHELIEDAAQAPHVAGSTQFDGAAAAAAHRDAASIAVDVVAVASAAAV